MFFFDFRSGPAAFPRKGWSRAAAIMVAAAVLAAPAALEAAPLRIAGTVLDGLANPRGLTFGSDGGLYVAEAGLGGDGPSITAGSGQTVSYGRTGGVTRLLNGHRERVATDLPSLAGMGGAEAVGPQDVAFGPGGGFYAVIGLGANPAARSGALAGEPGAALLGQLVKIEGGGAIAVADIAGFELANNPAGGPMDSNPFGLVAGSDGFVVSDAGANAVLDVGEDGAITLRTTFPSRDNPLPFGPPQFEPVPTGAAANAEGDVFVGELTGFPFPEGGALIHRLPEAGGAGVFADGLTNLIDLAFGPEGDLYALSYDRNGLLNPDGGGALFSIGGDGSASLLLAGLINPTGLTVGPNGDFYISEAGLSPGEGRVLRVAAVPLPPALPMMAALLGVFAWRFRRG